MQPRKQLYSSLVLVYIDYKEVGQSVESLAPFTFVGRHF